MGGLGSGRLWRFGTKSVVEDGLVLDLSRLIRDRRVKPGAGWSGILEWRNTDSGKLVASVKYAADMRDPDTAFMHLAYSHGDNPQDYKIRFTTTRPNYGGLRWWFLCPISGQRVGKLYCPPGQPVFGARKLFNLAYYSQNQDPLGRKLHKIQKTRRKYGGNASLDWPFPDKPKGMHWRTYEKLYANDAGLTQTMFGDFRRKFGFDC